MARRSQCSSQGDNPLDPHYLPPHYREEYRLAVDALVEEDLQGYHEFLQSADVVDFLCPPEVDHIRHTVQFPSQNAQPQLPYPEAGDNASSDTYWPLQSDQEAPSLDLGWPDHHGFLGPTEVTMLVNPSDPNMPTIKEQARRLISTAQQVIGVVMDMFTDVDIFADLLDAATRNVAVYILLDELNAHHFTAMVASFKVNLERIPLMRIRTVSGSTYLCRTGKSFKGQMKDRFLLVDCRAVLSGNYSFMWSFEKIHRCIAHLFLGELVTTYDEEFRILFAQSQALVTESILVPFPGESAYSRHMTQSSRDHELMQSSRYATNVRQAFGDQMDIDYNMFPFRRGHPSAHLRMEQSFMEQGRSRMSSMKMEMALKRHSYAEGSHDSYGSSQQLTGHRVRDNLEESTNIYKEQHYHHEVGSGSERGINYNIKSQEFNRADQFDSGYPPEMEPPGTYSHRANYLCYNPSKDSIHDSENHDSNLERGRMSQPSISQASSTQLHPSDLSPAMASHNRQSQDPGTKQGLRTWRINSFLSALGDEEEALTVPLGPDDDELPTFSEEKLCTPEPSVVKCNTEEFPRISSRKQELIPQHSWLNQPEEQKHPSGKHAAMTTGSNVMSDASGSSTATRDDWGAGEMEVREPREISIPKQESFRSRFNPLLQRSSRLRSSLIFSSYNLEQNSSTITTPYGLECKENQAEEDSGSLRIPSVVSQILDKNQSVRREQFNWSSHKKAAVNENKSQKLKVELLSENVMKASKLAEPKIATNQNSGESTEEYSVKASDNPVPKEEPAEIAQFKLPQAEKPLITASTESLPIVPSFINMDDPEMRFLYFKRLAAERKAAKRLQESAVAGPDLPGNESDTSLKTPDISQSIAHRTMDMKDNPVIGKVPAAEEATENPTETHTEKHEIEKIRNHSANNLSVTDPVRSLQSETFNWGSCNKTMVQEATNQNSEESTEEPSKQLPKDPLPKDKYELVEPTVLELPPQGKPIITAPTEALPDTSYINMDDPEMRFLYFKLLAAERKAAKLSEESTVGGPNLPENITGSETTLKMASKQENLDDTNIKRTDILGIGVESAVQEVTQNPTKALLNKPSGSIFAEPISQTETSVTPQSENKTPVVRHPERLDLQYMNSQPSAYVSAASKGSSDSFTEDILNPPEYLKGVGQTDPDEAGQEMAYHFASANRRVEPEANQISEETTEERSVSSLRPAGISLNLTDTYKNITDISIMGEDLGFQGATKSPRETLISKPPISSSPAEPIVNKPVVSIAQELENQIPAVVKRPSGPDFQYNTSQPSADVPLFDNSSPELYEKGSSKLPGDFQCLKMSCDTKIHQNASDTEKHKIKNASGHIAPNITSPDRGKSLQNKPFNLSSDSGTHEASDQKSKESTSEKSSKDYLPKEETKLGEIASGTSEVPVARAIDLSENITDYSLKTADISLNLTDTHMKMTDISVIEREPASQEAKSQKETLIDEPLTFVTPADPISHMPEDKNVDRDATDTEKRVSKIASGRSATITAPTGSGKSLENKPDSYSNLGLTGCSSEMEQDVKAMESMETHTQNPRSVMGTLGIEKLAEVVAEDETFSEHLCPPPEVRDNAPCVESQSPIEAKQAAERVVTKSREEKANNKASQSLYQTSPNSVIYNCNLRDDTKVILEQISANSQNRADLAKDADGSTDDAKMGKDERSKDIEGRPSKPQLGGTRFLYKAVDSHAREDLLKRMEKMRKEKKIYSRFEMGS